MMRKGMVMLVGGLLLGVMALGVGAGSVQDDFVIEGALAVETREAIPPDFDWDMGPRIVVEFAEAMAKQEIPPLPDRLEELIGQVADRIVLEFAHESRKSRTVYPEELIGDTTAPEMTDLLVSNVRADRATIAWTTDEWANSLVEYGVQSGDYTDTAYDPLWVKEHRLKLLDLSANTTYFYRATSADRSGNATSAEGQFTTPPRKVYLPVVLRGR